MSPIEVLVIAACALAGFFLISKLIDVSRKAGAPPSQFVGVQEPLGRLQAESGNTESPPAGGASLTDKRRNYFLRHWRGELSLPVAYWINGLAGNIIAGVITLAITSAAALKSDFNPFAAIASVFFIWVVLFSITCWQVVGIWRSATRYQRSGKFWGGLAKVMIAIGAIRLAAEFAQSGAPQLHELYKIYAGDEEVGSHAFRVLHGGEVLEFSGGITFGTAAEFSRFLSAMGEAKKIFIKSQGGRVGEAQKIAEIIKTRRLDTVVVDYCMSACTIIFLSGQRRFIAPQGRLGFHQPDFPGLTVEDRRIIVEVEEQRLRDLGVTAKFARRALTTSPNDMWFPSNKELLEAGVVTKVINQ